MKTKIFKVLIAVFTIAAIACGIKIYSFIKEAGDSKEDFNNIAELVETEKANPYEKLQKKNSDFVGWIKIDGTGIDYPVMQSKYDPDYYLHHSFEKEYSRHGVPYLDSECDIENSNNLIIYGHHMKDGSMFAPLVKYENEGFRETHQIIEFNTVEERSRYLVLAAFTYNADSQEFNYTHYTDMNEREFEDFIKEVKHRSIYDTGVNAQYGDMLLTLSTCEYSYANGRFVLVAKRVE